MRRSAGVLIGGVLLLAAAPGTAMAEAGYEANWITQTPANGTVIETGETITATMKLRNRGPNDWSSPEVKLGPSGMSAADRDKPSPLQAASWQAFNRIVSMQQATVAPGGEADFRFELTGPPTTSPVGIHQIVAPLYEGKGWMDGSTTGGIDFGGLYYDIVVRPSEPPKVTIDSAPASVLAGATVPVTATATDNVRVKTVAARVDDGPVVTLTGTPTAANVPTTGLAPGDHTLTVVAVDGAGNFGPASQPISIAADTGVANGAPAGAAKLTVGLTKRRRSTYTAPYGRKVSVGGRLTTTDGKTPIAGARLQLSTRVTGTTDYLPLGEVTTSPGGRWSAGVPAGTSRRLKVEYRALTLQPAPTAARTAALEVRAGLTLAVTRRGRVVRLSGRLRGGPVPRSGVLVSLQGKQAGDRWRPFKTVRAKGVKSAYTGRYRFKGGGSFRLRAVVNEQAGYPYSRGSAKSVRVRVP